MGICFRNPTPRISYNVQQFSWLYFTAYANRKSRPLEWSYYYTVDSLSYWPMFEEYVWSKKIKSICQYQRWCWWSENYSSSWFCFVNFCQIHIKFQYLAHINVIPPSAVSGKCKNVLILILKLLMNWQDILRSLHWFEPWNLASHF